MRNLNRDIAVFGLKGVLEGVIADHELNEQELLFLNFWCDSQVHIKCDPTVDRLLAICSVMTNDGYVTRGDLEEINDLIEASIQDALPDTVQDMEIKELLGIMSGISADGVINDHEIHHLFNWLEQHKNLKNLWPANVLFNRLKDILADGIISEAERVDLLKVSEQILGESQQDGELTYGLSTAFFAQQQFDLSLYDKSICFAGRFVSGPRVALVNRARRFGAYVQPHVSESLDYLIIGTLALRDWRFAGHGKQIEEVLRLRQADHPVQIITEKQWLDLTEEKLAAV